MRRKRYPSDLTDPQWALVSPDIPPAKAGGRPRTTDMRAVLDAILYLLQDRLPMAAAGGFPTLADGARLFPRWRIAGF